MTVEYLVQQYSRGAMANSEFVPRLLALLDGENADHVLGCVPPEAADDLSAFVTGYSPSARYLSVGNVPRPTAEQVETARGWLRDHFGRD